MKTALKTRVGFGRFARVRLYGYPSVHVSSSLRHAVSRPVARHDALTVRHSTPPANLACDASRTADSRPGRKTRGPCPRPRPRPRDARRRGSSSRDPEVPPSPNTQAACTPLFPTTSSRPPSSPPPPRAHSPRSPGFLHLHVDRVRETRARECARDVLPVRRTLVRRHEHPGPTPPAHRARAHAAADAAHARGLYPRDTVVRAPRRSEGAPTARPARPRSSPPSKTRSRPARSNDVSVFSVSVSVASSSSSNPRASCRHRSYPRPRPRRVRL